MSVIVSYIGAERRIEKDFMLEEMEVAQGGGGVNSQPYLLSNCGACPQVLLFYSELLAFVFGTRTNVFDRNGCRVYGQ